MHASIHVAARTLIERVLHDGKALDARYPTVFGARATGKTAVVEEDAELRAACALLTRELVVDGTRLRAGFIGSVVTDPVRQGRGWGTKLLQRAEGMLRDEGCVLAILWADERGFYARRGWREIGCERDFIVSAELVPSLPAATCARALRAADARALHALYSQHARRVERSLDETAELLACPGMQVLVHERDDAIDAYACLGRGPDLARVIHEWAGSTEGVLSLVRGHLEHRQAAGDADELYLMAPGPHSELGGRLALAGAHSAIGVLGMGKILDVEACGRLCAGLLDGAAVVRPVDAEHVTLSGPRGAMTLAREDLADIAFAARGERGAARGLGAALGLDASRLPLAPFVWGLDSI